MAATRRLDASNFGIPRIEALLLAGPLVAALAMAAVLIVFGR
jgi:hypothetical protein